MATEASSIPLLKKRLYDCLYYLDNDDTKTASLFFSSDLIDISKSQPFLKSYLEKEQNNNQSRDLRWKLNCLLSGFSKFHSEPSDHLSFSFQPDIELEYIDDLFKTSKDQIVTFLSPFLNGKKVTQPNDIHILSFYSLVFSESYPGIYDCIYSKFKKLFSETITLPKLYEILSTDFLYLLKEPPTDFVKSLPIDILDVPLFFKAAVNYTHPEFSIMLQNRFSLQIQYPSIFPQILNGDYFSLLNTSLVSEEHFFDIISHSVLENMTLGDFNEIVQRDFSFFDVNEVNKLMPYLLISFQPLLYADLANAIPILVDFVNRNKKNISSANVTALMTKNSSGGNLTSFVGNLKKTLNMSSEENFFSNDNSIYKNNFDYAIDLLKRFRNDQSLATLLTSITEVETNVNDLSNFSIPKVFVSCLTRKDILTQLSESNFYLINDVDKSTDLDFIRAFNVMSIFLMNFPAPPVSKQSLIKTQFEFTFEMGSILKDMSNIEMKKALCLDIFSILFMRKSNGQFVITIQYAKSVLSILSQHTDSKYILKGLAKVSKVNPKVNNDFNTLFIQDPKDFFNAIESGKFQVAYECAKNESLTRFFLLAYSIHLIILKTQIPIDAVEYTDQLNFEFCLSFDNNGFDQESDSKTKLLNMIGINPETTVLDIPSVQFEVRDEFNDTIKTFSEKVGIPQTKIEYLLKERAVSNSFYLNNRSINDDSISPFDDYEVRTSLNTFARDFDVNRMNEMRLPDYVMKSKSLTSFCAYLTRYYNYCMLCPYINPDSIYHSFNVFLPLRGIIESGIIEKAEEFCQFVHIDLFQFVIEHLSDFTLNQDFYDFYKSKYSLEIHAMQLSDQLSEKSRYEIDVETFSEDRIMYSIINMVKNNEKVDYDEIGYYNVDHHRLYKLFITSNIDIIAPYDIHRNYDHYYNTTSISPNHSQFAFNDEMINFLKMIDYVAPEDDLEMIDNIYFDHIKNLHQLNNDQSILRYFIDHQEYSQAFNMIDQKDTNGELFESVLKIHNNESLIRELFIRFSDRKFVELANEYCNDLDNLKYIHKYAPRDKMQIITGYISLPPIIRENSKIFNQQSIIGAFINHPDQIININDSHKDILTDSMKLQILLTYNDLKTFNTYAIHLYHLFNNKKIIHEKLNQIHKEWIQSLTINSIEKEEEAVKGILSIQNVHQFIDSSELTSRINAISIFLKYRLFSTYGIHYSFALFDDNNELLGDYLLSIALKFDLCQIENIIGQSFNADCDNLVLHHIKQQIQLGLIKQARSTIQDYELAKSTPNNKYKVYVDTYHEFMQLTHHSHFTGDFNESSNVKYFLQINLEHPFYSLFIHQSIFDTDFILTSFYPKDINLSYKSAKKFDTNELNQDNLIKYSNLQYSSIKYIRGIIDKKSQFDSVSELKFYARYSSIPSALIILNSTEQYDTAYQVLMGIPDEQIRNECFVYHFYPASFFYQSSKPQQISHTMPRPESFEQLPDQIPTEKTKKEKKKYSIASFFSKKAEIPNENHNEDIDFEALKSSLEVGNEYIGPNDDMAKIFKFLSSQDPESILTPSLFDSLAIFLEARNIYSILSQLYFYQHKLEDSALASIKSFATSAHKQYFISVAKSYLARTILMRYHKLPIAKNSNGAELPVLSHKLDDQSIMALKINVDLQSDILYYFVQNNFPFNEDYDILNNNETGASNCCAFFLLHLLFDMYERIRKRLSSHINNKVIIKKLAKELAKLKESEIVNVLNQLAVKYPPIKNDIISPLLQELSMTNNWQAIISLIMMIPDPYQQFAYFLEYDFLFEAYGVILNYQTNPNIRSLIPYLVHRASILGQIELIDQISP